MACGYRSDISREDERRRRNVIDAALLPVVLAFRQDSGRLAGAAVQKLEKDGIAVQNLMKYQHYAFKEKGKTMTTITTILSFMILVILLAFGGQNGAAVQMKFAWWNFQMSIHMVVFWAAVGGAAMITLLVLPKLGMKYMQTRRLQKQVQRLEKIGLEPVAEERKN